MQKMCNMCEFFFFSFLFLNVLLIFSLKYNEKKNSMHWSLVLHLLSHIPSTLFHPCTLTGSVWMLTCDIVYCLPGSAFMSPANTPLLSAAEQLKVRYSMNASHDIDGLMFLWCKLVVTNNDLSPEDNTKQCRVAKTIGCVCMNGSIWSLFALFSLTHRFQERQVHFCVVGFKYVWFQPSPHCSKQKGFVYIEVPWICMYISLYQKLNKSKLNSNTGLLWGVLNEIIIIMK